MIVKSIAINNFKSFGKSKNKLYIDSSPLTVIGRNESGKSNLLEAIGNVPYWGKNPSIFNSKNRSYYRESVSLEVETIIEDHETLDSQLTTLITKFNFIDHDYFTFQGALSEIISQDKDLSLSIERVIESKNKRQLWANKTNNDVANTRFNLFFEFLNNYSECFLYNFETKIREMLKLLNTKHPDFQKITESIKFIKKNLIKYHTYFPDFFYRKNDQELNHIYSFEEIKESIKDEKNILNRLIRAVRISEEDMIHAFTEKNIGARENLRESIEGKIKSFVDENFNEFYKQENIEFKPRFRDKELLFNVQTNQGQHMLLSERSNGLRWYLSLFIDIWSHGLLNSNVIFLFDEPGVHLHVNAQKELLNLFNDLTKNGNHVIYTTHSPSMIDPNNLLNIRVVEKDIKGNTEIFNKYYDQELSKSSKMETLSPLIHAIGSDMRFNIGPSFNNINLITEGITDFTYLKTMLPHLNINEDQINVIPSNGVNNIKHIVSLLIGWGCDFKVLLDYDRDGKKEYDTLMKELAPVVNDNIIFVNGKKQPSLEEIKENPLTIEDIIVEIQNDKLENKLNDKRDNKVLLSREFHDKFKCEKETPDEGTIRAFKQIFQGLDLIPVNKQV